MGIVKGMYTGMEKKTQPTILSAAWGIEFRAYVGYARRYYPKMDTQMEKIMGQVKAGFTWWIYRLPLVSNGTYHITGGCMKDYKDAFLLASQRC